MKPTNKQAAVLDALRQNGPLTVNEVADYIRETTDCGFCAGTGEGDDSRYGCRPCWGKGFVPFYYSDAYVALKALRQQGLVTRRFKLDEFGDEIPRHIYEAAPVTDDALEAIWNLPERTA